jgi:hypothetical protein
MINSPKPFDARDSLERLSIKWFNRLKKQMGNPGDEYTFYRFKNTALYFLFPVHW